jgi:hypothetical protein
MTSADAEERISHSGSLNHESDILHALFVKCNNDWKFISNSKVHSITGYEGPEVE